MSLHVSSATALIIRRSNCINTSSGMISLCKWLLGMPYRHTKQSLTQTNHTRWGINTIRSSDDEHLMLETCREMKLINKYMKKCIRLVINMNLWRGARSTKHIKKNRANVLTQEDGRITVSEVAEVLTSGKLKSAVHSRRRLLFKSVLLHHYNSRHPWFGRKDRDNSKPHVGGSATSTSQFRPHTMRLLSLWST